MKFTKIRLTGLTAIDLPIVGALPSDRYILKGVDGLGPTEVDVSMSDTINAGGVYLGRRPHNREPVIRIGLNPDHSAGQSASDLRSSLYGMLTPGSDDVVLLEIIDGSTVVASTVGYVKKLEIAPFSQTPEVQVTLACTQPYLQAPNILFVAPGGSKAAPEIVNTGNAPSGFHMEVIFSAPVSSWILTDVKARKMEFVHDFLAGDKLAFDTRPGLRRVELTRDLMTTKLLSALAFGSVWHMLHGGNNIFSASSTSYNWGDVYFRPLYWGI